MYSILCCNPMCPFGHNLCGLQRRILYTIAVYVCTQYVDMDVRGMDCGTFHDTHV